MHIRIATYAYLFAAGIATEFLVLAVLMGSSVFSRQYWHANGNGLLFYALPGFAAMAAARLVQRPYLRGVRARQRKRVYDWIVIGVIAAHAIYSVLVLLVNEGLHVNSYLSWAQNPLNTALGVLAFAAVSLALGFLPNLLFATCIAEAALRLENKTAGAPA